LPLRPKNIAGLKAGIHGGINYAELNALGIDPGQVLDFSVSTNPFMPPPGLKEVISATKITEYPDSQCTLLRKKLSEKFGIPAENILAGSGTTELIRLVASVYLRRSDHVLIVEPTYDEYEIACRLNGARTVKYRALEKDGFMPHIQEAAGLVQNLKPRAVFICSPNNPAGNYLSRRGIEKVLDVLEDGLLVLDEAYVAFVEKSWNSLDMIKKENIIVLRSMTKDYGLPGLRLGYAAAHRQIIDNLRHALPPWNVNAVAQDAGVYVLEQEEYLQRSLQQVRKAKTFLIEEFKRLGFNVLASDANYFLVKVGNAAEFRRSLLTKGILVRDCTSFGLDEYVRIAPRTLPECRKLVDSIKEVFRK
jgi:histidinol-phosphate aminotransferase